MKIVREAASNAKKIPSRLWQESAWSRNIVVFPKQLYCGLPSSAAEPGRGGAIAHMRDRFLCIKHTGAANNMKKEGRTNQQHLAASPLKAGEKEGLLLTFPIPNSEDT